MGQVAEGEVRAQKLTAAASTGGGKGVVKVGEMIKEKLVVAGDIKAEKKSRNARLDKY